MGNAQDKLNAIADAANKTADVIERIPTEVDLELNASVEDMRSVNDLIDEALTGFSELKERASFIEFNEINKLEIMERELINNQHQLSVMTDLLGQTRREWEAAAASANKSPEAVAKLYAEYLKVDKQVNSLGRGNYRILEQIDKQMTTLEKMKYPTDEIQQAEPSLKDITAEYEAQNAIIERQSQVIDKLQGAIDETKNKQSAYNAKLKEAEDSAGKLGDKIGGFVKAFLGIQAAKKGLEGTIGAAAELSQQVQIMQGMFGNADVGAAYFKQLQDYALKTGQSMEALSGITQQFMSTTRNTDKLMRLNGISEKLSIKNPTQGVEGAGYAINEALSGQFTSLKNRFNLTSAQLEPIKEAVKQGNLDGIIEAFDQGLNMAGITDAVVKTYRNTAPKQFESILNGFKSKFAEAGMSALSLLEPTLMKIKEWLDSESAATFFDNIAMGINLIVLLFTGFFNFVTDNWDVMSVVLLGIAIILGIIAIQALATKAQYIACGAAGVASGLATAGAWMLAHWPLLLLILIIGMAVAAFVKAGGKIEDIIGVIGGVLGVFWAYVKNNIAYFWNAIVSVAEFLANLFIDPVYAVKKLFYDLTLNVLKFFQGMIDGAIDALNWLIEKANSFFGTEFAPIESNFIDKVIAKLEANMPTSDKDVYNLDDMKIEFTDYGDAWNSGYEKGNKLFGQVQDTFDGFGNGLTDLLSYNGLQTDSLGSIDDKTGSIKDSLDLSNEDLKYLRDIAEQEAINQFTTNTVVPQLQVTFGDVKETADAKKIVGLITEMVEEELSVMPEGEHV